MSVSPTAYGAVLTSPPSPIVNDRRSAEGHHHRGLHTSRSPGPVTDSRHPSPDPCSQSCQHPCPAASPGAIAAHVIVANGARSDPFSGLHRHPASPPSLATVTFVSVTLPVFVTTNAVRERVTHRIRPRRSSHSCRSSTIGFGGKVTTTVASHAAIPVQ